MKHRTAVVVLIMVAFSQMSWAARGSVSKETVSGKPGVWMGTALDSVLVGSSTVPGYTSLFVLGERTALQAYLGIQTILPFYMGGGFAFKYSVAGDVYNGFHIGFGLGLGANANPAGVRSFYIHPEPLAGVHFELANRVMVSLESGVALKIYTNGVNNLDLTLGGNSLLFGASIMFGL